MGYFPFEFRKFSFIADNRPPFSATGFSVYNQ